MNLPLFHASLVILFLLQTFPQPATPVPLSTSGRWIVDEYAHRVKLACVNWPSHLQPMVAEGLNKRPLDSISKSIVSMGFNCVRFTWPVYLVTNDSLATVTVRQSFQWLSLDAAIAGIQGNNPWILDQTLIQAFKAVVANLGKNKIMVILDNHISKPGWCCDNQDGNGFFWDEFFNPDDWITGLTRMATMFNGVPNVIGMSLRNELRGPKQNVPDWYRYMQMGAEAVHKANPNVLVILSGLNYDTDLSFLSSQKAELTFSNKLVHEVHWYSFTNSGTWKWNANDACHSITSSVMSRAGFLLSQGLPLFMSEWGVDQRGGDVYDNRYLGCFLALAAVLDVDWSLWALQGSYYLREGMVDPDEVYGALSFDWSGPRNSSFLQRIVALRSPNQGPGYNSPRYTILFHPATGLCIVQDNRNSPLRLGSCSNSKALNYTEQKTIQLVGTNLCWQQSGDGSRVMLESCSDDSSLRWDLISDTKMHVSSESACNLCLDVNSDGDLVTSQCRCLSRDASCDPEGQWFTMVPSTKPLPSPLVPNEFERKLRERVR